MPFKNIKRACIAAVELGLKPLINIESGADSSFSSKDVYADNELKPLIMQGKISICNGLWIPFKTGYNKQKNNGEKRIIKKILDVQIYFLL